MVVRLKLLILLLVSVAVVVELLSLVELSADNLGTSDQNLCKFDTDSVQCLCLDHHSCPSAFLCFLSFLLDFPFPLNFPLPLLPLLPG